MEHLEDIYELSPMQEGMLFHTLYNPRSNMYFEQTGMTLRGVLDRPKFKQAWQRLLKRHQILRTAFYWEEMDKPLQVVHRKADVPWHEEDWRGRDNHDAAYEAFLQADQKEPFPLDTPPLMRFALIQVADDVHYFVWSHHHLLLDGWSVPLLLDEVFGFYNGARRRPRPRPYREYITWLQKQDKSEAERYWQNALAGIYAPTPLTALSFERQKQSEGVFGGMEFVLSAELTTKLEATARQNRVTFNTLMQGAWSLLLSRYSREEEIVFGATVSGRPPKLRGSETMVGLFINTLPVRVDVAADQPLVTWLQGLQQAQVEREQFAYTPLVDIQNWSNVPRGTALFESIIVFENYPMDGGLAASGVTIDDFRTFEHTNYPLTVEAIVGSPTYSERVLSYKLKYDKAHFDDRFIDGMGRHLQTLLTAIADNPARLVGELPLLAAEERAHLLGMWDDHSAQFKTGCLHQWFERQVARHPDAVAVVYENERLTYQALNDRANQLAHRLQKLGVRSETLVGLCLERSAEMVIAVLAILKAGGAYLPIDTAYPQERVDFMLNDAKAPVLLTESGLSTRFSNYEGHQLLLDLTTFDDESPANPTSETQPDSLAYVIYTSGSTGKPKGVMVTHANATRLFTATDKWYAFGEQDVWMLFHSIAFDFSVWELWGALLYGGRLVVVPYLVSRSPEAFYRLLVDEQVTVLNQTPSAFRQLMQAEEMIGGDLPDQLALRYVIFGGEALEMASLRGWFERHGDDQPQLVNMYGITETTVHVTHRPISWQDVNSLGSVIGQPIPDLQLYILDEHLEPAPVGIAGEIYVAGAGVSNGYLNRPELTADRFIEHPDIQSKVYKTGDLARYLPNGDVEYLGRIDHQVKIRGFRIELGEIEHALAQHPAVREQIVLVREDEPGHKRLVAYVVLADEQSISDIRADLQQKLPAYMVPATFVTLPTMPLTPNGKTDRRALPAPEQENATQADNFIAPRTAEEKALAEIWSEVLDIRPIGIHDNFFDLGGDSILSIRVLSKAKERQLSLSLEQLFEHQTIYEIAQHVSPELVELPKTAPFSLINEADRALLSDTIEDAYPLTRLQSGMLFHSDFSDERALYHNVNTLHLRAAFDEQVFHQAVADLVATHPILRTAFEMEQFSEPLQLVYRTVATPLTVDDLRGFSAEKQTTTIQNWFETQQTTLFAWNQAPLIRFHIHQRDEQHFQFSWAEHHAIIDGWSMASMISELLQRYLAGLAQHPFVAPPIESSFRDYVALEQQTIASPDIQQHWLDQLSNAEPTTLPRLPDTYRTDSQSKAIDVSVTAAVSDGLKTVAQTAGVPLKSVLLAAHLKVMSVLANERDVITGLAWNGRLEEHDGERVLGLFLNTLPLRLALDGGSWLELAQATFAAERATIPYRRYPYADIQKQSGGHPLFESAFNFTHFHIYQTVSDVSGMKILDGQFFQETNFPLLADFSLDLSTAQLLLSLSFDGNELDAQQVAAIGDYYVNTLTAMAEQPEARYEAFSPLTTAEQQQLQAWNDTTTAYPREKSIHALFEQQAAQTPDATAVVLADVETTLTYRQLNERANQVAYQLRAEGVGTETLVGICVERSLEMMVGLLGILKAGGTFVPFDPDYPAERIAFMLDDTQVPVMLTQTKFLAQLPPTAKTICLDTYDFTSASTNNLDNSINADSLAYIMYTSGSTGKPKGVCVTHRNVVRLVQNANFADLDADQVFLQLAPISFDASTLEIWGALLNGAKLVVMPPQPPSLETLATCLERHQVSILWLTAGFFNVVVDEQLETLRGVRQLLAGGDVLSVPHVQKVLAGLPDTTLINGYGPTENTTFTTCFPIREMRGFDHPVPIGRPISNTQTRILNDQMQPVPVGVFAELYAGGDGVARGYYNRPKLTADRFIDSPYGKLYKTGDLARYLPDGNIDFLGRRDTQVKVRGYRIELGEIETVLGQMADVREVVVIVRDESGSKRIVAYVVTETGDTEPFRGALQERLPDYMIPHVFVSMDALPLNPNGKIDRRALPAPEWSGDDSAETYTAPTNDIEQALAKIWAGVMNVPQIGVNDNFFSLGGDSILSIQIVSRARQAGIQVSTRQLFECQTIAELARVATMDKGVQSAEQGLVSGDVPLTPIQHWFFEKGDQAPHHFNQSALFEIPATLSSDLIEASVQQLLQHHDALRLRFTQNEDGWQQTNAVLPATTPFGVIDLSHLSTDKQVTALDAEATKRQAGFDLAAGSLLDVTRFVLGGEQADRLLIIIHHLAVDGVSWRILSEDFETAYQQFERGEQVQLPPKTSSFKAWAHELSTEGIALVEDEREHWQESADSPAWPLPIDWEITENRVADSAQVGGSLSAEQTHALLHEVPDVYNTQVNDLLLTALLQTFADWTGDDTLLLDLEGHGREELFDTLDISRTVGWFTCIYPVSLELNEDHSGAAIKSIKEQLRQIPQNGIGYGILRYLNNEPSSRQPEISFNYLGQFQAPEAGAVLQKMRNEPSGALYSPDNGRAHLIDIVGMVVDGALRIDWIYNQRIHAEETIQSLSDAFIEALGVLIEHCQSPDAFGRTVSDFPDAELNQDELETLLSLL